MVAFLVGLGLGSFVGESEGGSLCGRMAYCGVLGCGDLNEVCCLWQ